MAKLNNHIQQLSRLTRTGKGSADSAGLPVRLTYVGRNGSLPSSASSSAPSPIKKKVKAKSTIESWMTAKDSQWVVQAQFPDVQSHYGYFSPSAYSMARDLIGTCYRQIGAQSPKSLTIEYVGGDKEELKGLCVGLEMAQYSFKNQWPKLNSSNFAIKIKSDVKEHKSVVESGSLLGESVNLARFLVDCPPNVLTPKSYADLLKDHFGKKAKTKVTVWNEARLVKEKMGLHLAVGQGSEDKSYMIHIEYRGGGKEKPIAFVGKGITFDSGGLDIKPGAGMRLMKKDMGGSASVAGIANQVVHSKAKINCDFYFAVAENAVNEKAFRPGDVLTSRSGKTVEIHNTDAEGRLVLADVLTVAAEKKPQLLIDIATLTGAIKYGLGADVPGLFSNSDNLAETLLQSGQAAGDVFWRMPLVPGEKSRLKSDVADMVNCTEGYGGAITAALFLEKFTDGIPWAHLDIYAWATKAGGAIGSAGGSGQVVQAMSHFLETSARNQD